MAQWTLAEIRQKVRYVTGRFSEQEMTTSDVDNRINRYTQYAMPADLKLERIHTYYEFVTLANVQSYTVPDGYVNFEPPATVNAQEILWYQSPDFFWGQSWLNYSYQTIGVGTGVLTTFAGTANGFPLVPGTAIITDDIEVFNDTNKGWTTANVVLTGSLGGTGIINYVTGAVTVNFATAPLNGQKIKYSYQNFRSGTPAAVLLYNNQFTFFPIPDTSYRFRVQAYANSMVMTTAGVTQPLFVNATDRPLLDEWGPCIVYGTARDIFSDRGEMDSYAETTLLYQEQMAYSMKRTINNLLNSRSQPAW